MKKLLLTAISLLAFSTMAADAEPTGLVGVVCPLSGPGVAACAVAGTVLHEGVQAANGKKAFSDSGEGKKALKEAGRKLEKIRKKGLRGLFE